MSWIFNVHEKSRHGVLWYTGISSHIYWTFHFVCFFIYSQYFHQLWVCFGIHNFMGLFGLFIKVYCCATLIYFVIYYRCFGITFTAFGFSSTFILNNAYIYWCFYFHFIFFRFSFLLKYQLRCFYSLHSINTYVCNKSVLRSCSGYWRPKCNVDYLLYIKIKEDRQW